LEREDNFKDESLNLSAIVNLDENEDNGSIEIERKRLSKKVPKKDLQKTSKRSLALNDIKVFKNQSLEKEQSNKDL